MISQSYKIDEELILLGWALMKDVQTFTNGMVDCLSLLSAMINDLINTPSASS